MIRKPAVFKKKTITIFSLFRHGIRDSQEGTHIVRPVQEVPGRPHEDLAQLPALLHQVHQTQRVQETHGQYTDDR